jgi:multidrug resistance efflux pump
VAVAHVDVEGGLVYLYPTRPGRVVEVKYKEGDKVEGGKVILRVDDVVAKIEVKRAEAALDAAQTKLGQAKLLELQHKLKAKQAQAGVDAAQADLAAARETAAKAKRFYNEKLGGSAEDVKAAEQMVKKAEAGVRARKAEQELLLSMDPQLAVRLASADVKNKKAQLDLANKGVSECSVLAPENGTLLRLQTQVGAVLGDKPDPRMMPLVFCPNRPLIIRAEVEQEFAGGVRLNQTATITDDATGGGDWAGTVTHISGWIGPKRSIQLEPGFFNDVRTLEVIITVKSGRQPLRIGQRVRVALGQ